MKLYVYDHCPFCAKARMIFGLKSLPVELQFVLEDDVDTPTGLVGKKTTPILEKADHSHMAESMDIVRYVDGLHGTPVVTPVEDNSAIKLWHDAAWRPILKLSIPRLARADLPEFATETARAAFESRQTKNFGAFEDLLAQSPDLIRDIEGRLTELDDVLAGREHVDADDFVLYPSLRMLSIVKGVQYPANVKRYIERMEQATGVGLHFAQAS
ncbi:glutaredoxin 2 [Pelagibacterium lacus]|uniref:Glutaredoxin 2 n=1 Tax=Pelagibacterium lacus TaxID=2282655 RepID=A0A369W6U6_9HYPH|nr:glutaredoxin 2 [Pelagibacterium lacus]RDE10416.1 glutaredoxin 2 [Pelagibacterium lacus]